MHENLLYAVTSTIENKLHLKCGIANDEIFQGFEELDLDLDIKRLFQWRWFLEDIEIGPSIYSSERILEQEKLNNYLKSGLIEIGYCPNGDEIFLRTKDTAILYWSHDEAEAGDWNVKEENCLYLAYSKAEYLFINVCNQNFIPWDSYSAREYYELYCGK